jgi:hypothetical protein
MNIMMDQYIRMYEHYDGPVNIQVWTLWWTGKYSGMKIMMDQYILRYEHYDGQVHTQVWTLLCTSTYSGTSTIKMDKYMLRNVFFVRIIKVVLCVFKLFFQKAVPQGSVQWTVL